MLNLLKVAHQIKTDILYNTLYFEIKERLNLESPSESEILTLIKSDNQLLDEYRDINTQTELSNIQLNELHVNNTQTNEKEIKESINAQAKQLRELEGFSSNSENSAYSIWIGSVGVMFIFMFHNYFSLYSEAYHTNPLFVYSLYGGILFITYWAYKKMKANHEKQHQVYNTIYSKLKSSINDAINSKIVTYTEIYKA